MPYESCKDKHKIKFSIKLSSAVSHPYPWPCSSVDVLDLIVPSVLLDLFFLQETVEMRAKCQVDQTQDVIIGM